MKMSEGISSPDIDEYFFQLYRIWKWQLYLLNSFIILYIWNNSNLCIKTSSKISSCARARQYLAAKKQVYKFDLSSFWELFEVLVHKYVQREIYKNISSCRRDLWRESCLVLCIGRGPRVYCEAADSNFTFYLGHQSPSSIIMCHARTHAGQQGAEVRVAWLA